MYRFRVKGKVYGRYDDENKAALARDYAARRIAALFEVKVREVNSDQFFHEDTAEKSQIDRWVDKTVMHVRSKVLHGIQTRKRTNGSVLYMVRVHVGDQCVHFGSYNDEEFACLVSDYVARELLKKGPLNYPDKELAGQSELKNRL